MLLKNLASFLAKAVTVSCAVGLLASCGKGPSPNDLMKGGDSTSSPSLAPLAMALTATEVTLANHPTASTTGGESPVTLSIQSGSATIDSSGVITATSTGTVTVKATGANGLFVTADLTVDSNLTAPASLVELVTNESSATPITSTGGVPPITSAIVSSSATFASGIVTAGASPATDILRFTDAFGNTADVPLTINAALTIAPATASTAPNGQITLTAAGGFTPYIYSITSGTGSVDSSSGVFTAPGSTTLATVRATDRLGHTADSVVTVVTPVVIAPATAILSVNNTKSFSASGGLPPYTYSVASGGGTISSGTYTAPGSAGTSTVRVTDSLGQTADAAITINAVLAISPATKSLDASDAQTFTSTGGVAPIVYSVVSGGGTINASTGAYTAPATAASVVVRATDSLSNHADSAVTVFATLAISPATLTMSASGLQTFTATGGAAPLVYSVVSGGGSINASTGAFTAPVTAASVVVRVTDSLSHHSDSTVTVSAPLTISPATLSLDASDAQTFTSTGGTAPIAYSILSGGGTINSSTGAFTAPATAASVIVRATDSLGSHADSTVTVHATPAISPATLTMTTSGSQTFTTTGGLSPLVYSVVSGGGSINASTGAFTAPATAATVVVRVTDSLSHHSDSTVTVNAPLAISPVTLSLDASDTQTFSSTGGSAPITYSVLSGGGSINASTGAFAAPATAATVTVRATDSLSNHADATVTVFAALVISPSTVTLSASGLQTFTATGGSSPLTYSVVSGGGSINATTGAFTAPATSATVVVRVTDSLSHHSDSTVTVSAPLAISPTTADLAASGTKTFTSTGGTAPITYSILSGGGSVNSSTGAFIGPNAAASIVVRATDSLGTHADSAVTVHDPLVISPSTVTLAASNTKTFTSTGGKTPYVYSIVSGGGSINASTGAFTAPATSATVIVKVTDALSSTSQSTVTVNAALALAPAATFAVVSTTKTFTASGGVSPYTYSVLSGDGGINSSGVYTAPATAEAVTLKVTDSLSNTATASVTIVLPLQISPATLNATTGGAASFAATGGETPYVFSVLSGGGTIDPDAGDYAVPDTSGIAKVRVTDAFGLTADATITVYDSLDLEPQTLTIGPSHTYSFAATGGMPPLTYSVPSGTGTIDPSTGVYTAPPGSGTDTVRVTDNLGNTSDVTITISGVLLLSPATFKMAATNTKQFTASSGVPPYTYSVVSGSGTIDSTGKYIAGTSSDDSVVRVTDSIGSTFDSAITIVVPSRLYSANYNNCMIYDDGSLRCWGDGSGGQLGNGKTTDLGDKVNTMDSNLAFIDLGTGRTAKDVSIGVTYICAILDNNSVKCWGLNTYGNLGLGDVNKRGATAGQMGDALPVVNLGTGRTAKKIYAGQTHTCAILDNDTTKCWGQNTYGQLGLGDTTTRGSAAGQMGDSLPVVSLGTGKYATSLALGSVSTCAILNDGTMKCWGRNNRGQLLQGNTTTRGSTAGQMGDSLAVSSLGTGLTLRSITAGVSHFCANFADGSVKCWGQGTNGVLGSGATAHLGDAVAETGNGLPFVNLGTGVTASAVISSSNSSSTCAILSTGAVKCWGLNTYGTLGQGTVATIGDGAGEMGDALAVTNLGTGFVTSQLGMGLSHACAMSTNNTVKCWGRATNGALGNASTTLNLGDGAGEMGNSLAYVGI